MEPIDIDTTASQNRELDLARFIVEKTNGNLFLTGKAGTGKTTFLRDLVKFTKKKHIVLAPTGIAAVNAGGMTIHSFFQFGFGPYVKGVSEPSPNFRITQQKLEMIRSIDLLIIDEVSMVRADLMDRINDELQRIRHNNEPFGGIQLLMIGDLQQLPPVADVNDGLILGARYPSTYFFDSFALKNSHYSCIDLKAVFRQTDNLFIDILNRMRNGQLTQNDIAQLNARYIPMFIPRPGEYYIRLVTHNSQADAINREEMERLREEPRIFDAEISSEFPENSFPTNSHLELKRHAQVMFIKNDPDKRFVNGTLGIVEDIDGRSVCVKLSDTDEIVEVEAVDWQSIKYRFNKQTGKIETQVLGTFKQLPLKAAWAITVHKSQGLTFEKIQIDISRAFAPGQAYVAMSRCRTLDGIVLNSPVTASAFITDSTVQDYMNGIVQDIDDIAHSVNYEYFDYDRSSAVQGPSSKAKKARQHIPVFNQNVYDALKSWRLQISKATNIPAYCVITDRCMASISNLLPENKDELLSAFGMGTGKTEHYGIAILDVIRASRTTDNTKHTDSIAQCDIVG